MHENARECARLRGRAVSKPDQHPDAHDVGKLVGDDEHRRAGDIGHHDSAADVLGQFGHAEKGAKDKQRAHHEDEQRHETDTVDVWIGRKVGEDHERRGIRGSQHRET